MARIRSVHPGLFTDEAFATLTMPARVLLIGLWTECDDQGAFEWKPVTLKMRLMPADNVDIAALLEELAAANTVRSYEHDGRKLGAVRNFRKYQRPKKPNSIHFMPTELRTYVGLSPPSSEPETLKPPSIPQKGEKSPQMEDGGKDVGGRVKEEKKQVAASAAATNGTFANGAYAFNGQIIKLNQQDYDRWKQAYSSIPDFDAALTKADDYYREHPPAGGKWFHAVSRWLEKDNAAAQQLRHEAKRGVDFW